jgi:hypothetical protein
LLCLCCWLAWLNWLTDFSLPSNKSDSEQERFKWLTSLPEYGKANFTIEMGKLVVALLNWPRWSRLFCLRIDLPVVSVFTDWVSAVSFIVAVSAGLFVTWRVGSGSARKLFCVAFLGCSFLLTCLSSSMLDIVKRRRCCCCDWWGRLVLLTLELFGSFCFKASSGTSRSYKIITI